MAFEFLISIESLLTSHSTSSTFQCKFQSYYFPIRSAPIFNYFRLLLHFLTMKFRTCVPNVLEVAQTFHAAAAIIAMLTSVEFQVLVANSPNFSPLFQPERVDFHFFPSPRFRFFHSPSHWIQQQQLLSL